MLTVVDASAVAAILFSEPELDEISQRLNSRTLAAPHLLSHELANVAIKKFRRNGLDLDSVVIALGRYAAFDIALYEIDPVAATLLAAATGLSAYDASYLWLARHLDAPLVTLDRKLALVANA